MYDRDRKSTSNDHRLTKMSPETLNNNSVVVRNVVDGLQKPIPDLPTLLALLSGPLDSLGLLPPQFRHYNREPLPSGSVDVLSHIPSFQRAILDYIAPTWDALLLEEDAGVLLDQYFCPDSSFASPTARNVVLLAYASILSQPLTNYGIDLLAHMTTEYPVDRLHAAFFSRKDRESPSKGMLGWEDYVRNIVMVPAKVANSIAGKADISPVLEHGTYFNNLCAHCESLIYSLATESSKGASQSRCRGALLNCTTTRCDTFSVLFISKTCTYGSLPRRAADISLAAIFFPDHSNYDSCSTTGRSF
jgi:telomere length regulation protein